MPQLVTITYTPHMLTFDTLALELLSYKVSDYLRGDEPRGGTNSMWKLMEELQSRTSELDPPERELLEWLAQRLDEHERAKPKEATDTLDSLILGEDFDVERSTLDTDPTDMLVVEALQMAPAPDAVDPRAVERHESDEERAERETLQRIAEQVWWDDLAQFLQRTAASWRADRERISPRLVYATMQNLERHATVEGFGKDVNLRRFKVTVPMPERNDPLVSFSDPESLAEIGRDLLETILSVRNERGLLSDLDVPNSGALSYVREVANRVSQDPYAGKLSVMSASGPSSEQLRVAIRELSKERMSEAQKTSQRRHLEQRLAETLAHERSQRQMFQRDVHRFGESVHAFFERLADQLPPDVGGKGAGPQLATSVLFGVNPALRVDRVPPGAEAITARLIGPIRISVGGIDVAVSGSGRDRALFVGDQQIPLDESRSVDVDGKRLDIYVADDYLHLRVRDGHRSLASWLAEATVVFYVLSRPQSDNLLATLALVSNAIRGEAPNLISTAIERIGAITASSPNRRDAIEGLVRGSARAVGASLEENVLMGLVQRLHVAITAQPGDLPTVLQQLEASDSGVHQLGSTPVTIDIGGNKLTLREYEGGRGQASSVVLMLPGHVLGSFAKYLIEPFSGGTLVCAHAEQEVAVAYVPDVTIATPRAV